VTFMRLSAIFFFFLSGACCAAGSAKLSLAVSDLRPSGIEQSEADLLSDRLRSELVETGIFTVVERTEMAAILQEQGFQQSGTCDNQSCLVEVGQLLGVRQIVAGTVGKIGAIYTVNARLIDVATGKILLTEAIDCRCPIDELLRKSIPELAQRIALRSSGHATETGPRPEEAAVQTRRKPLLTRWYFWAPVAVLAGGAGYLVYASLHKSGSGPETESGPGAIEVTW
jgi:TolB-like protein